MPTFPLAALPPTAPLLVLLLCVAALNPVGYSGGGADDWHYLEAARCWAENGPCLPHDHWSARWPLVAPMAAALALFGESRFALALVPLAYAAAALALFAWTAERLFGRNSALIGGLLLLVTPMFALALLQPNVDTVELAFLLGAGAFGLAAVRSGRAALSALAGVALAMATLTRETSFVFVALAGLWFAAAPAEERKVLRWAALGFALPLAAEALAYWLATGDALRRIDLALGHARIPSAELAAGVDTSTSPILNRDFIAAWRPANGIDAHWTVKPLVNLVTHLHVGPTLFAGGLLFLAFAREPFVPRETVRRAGGLLAATGLAAAVLTYVLAIDPKPRMFLPLACACAAAAGAMVPHAWQAHRRFVPAAVALLTLTASLIAIAIMPRIATAEAPAARWIEAAPGAVTLDETTRRHLALVPAARALPVGDGTRLLRLDLPFGPCRAQARPGETVERGWSFEAAEGWPARLVRRSGIALSPGRSYSLCLFRRR